jgi:hypothetical protein
MPKLWKLQQNIKERTKIIIVLDYKTYLCKHICLITHTISRK